MPNKTDALAAIAEKHGVSLDVGANPSISYPLISAAWIGQMLSESYDAGRAAAKFESQIHYHTAKYVDDVLVRECRICEKDLTDPIHYLRKKENE